MSVPLFHVSGATTTHLEGWIMTFPFHSIVWASNSSFLFPCITCIQRMLSFWAPGHLGVFGMEAGKDVFIKPVRGATGYSCYKTHSGEKMLASVNGIIRPLPHGATTLDSKCTGEQSLFLLCILSVVLPSVVLRCCRVAPLTPLTFDMSCRHIS